jgi:hypothetical protein
VRRVQELAGGDLEQQGTFKTAGANPTTFEFAATTPALWKRFYISEEFF